MTISILILGFKGLKGGIHWYGSRTTKMTSHGSRIIRFHFHKSWYSQHVKPLLNPVLTHRKSRKDVCENTAKRRQGKEWLQIANFRISSLFIDNSNNCPLRVVTAGGNILNCYRHYVVWNWISMMWFEKKLRKLILCSKKINSSSILAIASTFLNGLKLWRTSRLS